MTMGVHDPRGTAGVGVYVHMGLYRPHYEHVARRVAPSTRARRRARRTTTRRVDARGAARVDAVAPRRRGASPVGSVVRASVRCGRG